jgi:hypothetical protein
MSEKLTQAIAAHVESFDDMDQDGERAATIDLIGLICDDWAQYLADMGSQYSDPASEYAAGIRSMVNMATNHNAGIRRAARSGGDWRDAARRNPPAG